MSLRLELDKELEDQFRKKAMEKFGHKKGSIKHASIEAINCWLHQTSKPRKKKEDAVALIDGVLKKWKGKVTSVDLQHESTKVWLK